MSDPPTDEIAIARLATEQWGVVTRSQLVAAGWSETTILRRETTGRLYRVHPTVFAFGHGVLRDEGRYLAALLAIGPAATLSHHTAAALWGLSVDPPAAVHVTTPRRSGRALPGITLHRVRRLRDDEVCGRGGFRCTTVARTILDLADLLTVRRIGRLIEEAEAGNVLDLPALFAACEAAVGRRGRGRLARALSAYRPRPKLTRSELEARFLRLCGRHGVPMPRVNERVAGLEVDFTWPDARLAVETDGRAYHVTLGAFDRDRRRDATLTVAGWRVVRFTWSQVVDEPAQVAAVLRALLAGGSQIRQGVAD